MDFRLRLCVYANAIIAACLALYAFIIPAGMLVNDLCDPALRDGGVPRFAFRRHRALSGDYEAWARGRVASGEAAALSVYGISGTEWPVFGSVFYLWATEALQEAWEEDPTLAPAMPAEYARGAIEAAAALVADPGHAAWVRAHWGDDYLDRENLFYRMLLISGLTSYQRLLGDDRYEPLLAEQAGSLADEIDASPNGLLDDCPGQCYPVDVLAAIAAIRRADGVLGTDRSPFVARALRAFEGEYLDPLTGLLPFRAFPETGRGFGPSRGCGNSFVLTWAPELWPETARQWYAAYEAHFWQEGWLLAGLRELSGDIPYGDWFLDVDAGPVLAGYGTAASAFGIGAARTHGRFDHAYPLSGLALVASWPLPDGSLLGARALSNLSDAPYLGEAALLFSLTRRPLVETIVEGGRLPAMVYFGLLTYVLAGFGCVGWAAAAARRRLVRLSRWAAPNPRLQALAWAAFALGGGALLLVSPAAGVLLLLLARLLPSIS
jgi:hypothetical protein